MFINLIAPLIELIGAFGAVGALLSSFYSIYTQSKYENELKDFLLRQKIRKEISNLLNQHIHHNQKLSNVEIETLTDHLEKIIKTNTDNDLFYTKVIEDIGNRDLKSKERLLYKVDKITG